MDKRTFEEQVQRSERTLYRIAMSYTGNVSDAADAVQEALLRAWNRRHTLRNEQLFVPWLTRIVINECKTLLKKRKRTFPMDAVPEKQFQPPPDADMQMYSVLFGLSEKYRVPLVLHALEGYTFQEIASILHLPPNTIKTRVSRARQKLRQEVMDDAE